MVKMITCIFYHNLEKKRNPLPLRYHLPIPPTLPSRPLATTNLFYFIQFPVLDFPVNGIIQYGLCDWFLSLSVMLSQFIQVLRVSILRFFLWLNALLLSKF